MSRTPPPAPSLRPVLAVAGGLVVLLTLLVGAFTWPPSELEPRSLPIAVVGDDRAVGEVSAGLRAAAGPDGFDVLAVADRDAALEAVQDRKVYGALVPPRASCSLPAPPGRRSPSCSPRWARPPSGTVR